MPFAFETDDDFDPDDWDWNRGDDDDKIWQITDPTPPAGINDDPD